MTHSKEGYTDTVELLYEVSFDDAGERKSVFVTVQLRRGRLSSGGFDWRIMQTTSGVHPEG